MPTELTFPDSAAKNAAGEFETEKMSLSMGPSHPSTHGVLRVQLELDGEVVIKADPVIGYLHRGDEKIAENMTYNQFVPYTDRLDYLAPLANNMAYAIAVEKLAKLEVPPRCQAIRVITAEMARISAHLLGLGRSSCIPSRSGKNCTSCSRSSPGRASPRATRGSAASRGTCPRAGWGG
jgi:NADH-quinone oxidoreductase subunit D